jgi:Leucine-rich repeat (LRR) protein
MTAIYNGNPPNKLPNEIFALIGSFMDRPSDLKFVLTKKHSDVRWDKIEYELYSSVLLQMQRLQELDRQSTSSNDSKSLESKVSDEPPGKRRKVEAEHPISKIQSLVRNELSLLRATGESGEGYCQNILSQRRRLDVSLYRDIIKKKQQVKDYNNAFIDFVSMLPPNLSGAIVPDEELELDNNDLAKITRQFMMNLEPVYWKEYTELCIEITTLTVLPPEISYFQYLQKLYLSNNNLSELPPELGLLKRLKFLDVSFNKLTNISAATLSLLNLEELHIDDNNLTDLPSKLTLSSRLRIISASKNKISFVNKHLATLPYLNYLNLHDNQLRHVHRWFFCLEKARVRLSNNRLDTLPFSFSQMLSISHRVDIRFNPIMYV